MSNILKPVKMQYSSKSTNSTPNTPKTPPPPYSPRPSHAPPAEETKRTPSFFERLKTAWTATAAPPEPVRVRLINEWSDVSLARINIVLCNFLYDEKLNINSMWLTLEEATTFRREHIFFALSAFLAYVLFAGNLISSLLVITTVVLPLVCSLAVLNEGNMDSIQNWLKYWTIYGIVALLEHLMQRLNPDVDVRILKLIILGACLAPYVFILGLLYETINRPFVMAKDNFEKYNFQHVQ